MKIEVRKKKERKGCKEVAFDLKNAFRCVYILPSLKLHHNFLISAIYSSLQIHKS